MDPTKSNAGSGDGSRLCIHSLHAIQTSLLLELVSWMIHIMYTCSEIDIHFLGVKNIYIVHIAFLCHKNRRCMVNTDHYHALFFFASFTLLLAPTGALVMCHFKFSSNATFQIFTQPTPQGHINRSQLLLHDHWSMKQTNTRIALQQLHYTLRCISIAHL